MTYRDITGKFLPQDPYKRIDSRAVSVGDCLLWYGKYFKKAPQIKVNNRLVKVSHLVLARNGKPRPSKEHYACHTCDNPGCVKYEHLWWGTAKENSQDMVSKGRQGVKSLEGIENISKACTIRANSREERERFASLKTKQHQSMAGKLGGIKNKGRKHILMLSVDDGKIIAKNNIWQHHKRTGYLHTWIEL